MKKIGLLALISTLITPSLLFAQDYTCSPLSTCEDLGYVFTEEDCKNKAMLKCPFDNTKVYCKLDVSTPCKEKDVYKTTLAGCPLNQNGEYTIIAVNSAAQECTMVETGSVYTEVGLGSDILQNATANCEGDGGVLASHLDVLYANKIGYTFSSDIDITSMPVLTSTAGAVSLKKGVIEKYDVSELEDEFAYICSYRKSCPTQTTSNIDPVALTCVPGAYRVDGSKAPYYGGCLGDSTEAGTDHFIVETASNGNSAYYFKLSQITVTPSDSLANAKTYALNTVCTPDNGGLPKPAHVDAFFNLLYKQGKLEEFKNSPAFQESSGFVITNGTCYDFNNSTPGSNNLTCGASGGKFLVMCSYYASSIFNDE